MTKLFAGTKEEAKNDETQVSKKCVRMKLK
jgi:hypothetical protein